MNQNSCFGHILKMESFVHHHIEWQLTWRQKFWDQLLIASCKYHIVGLAGKLVIELLFFPLIYYMTWS